jgi:hypothetical protein
MYEAVTKLYKPHNLCHLNMQMRWQHTNDNICFVDRPLFDFIKISKAIAVALG